MFTFVTSWYRLNSKFNPDKYYGWIRNLFNNIRLIRLIVYTSRDEYEIIKSFVSLENRDNIIFRIKEFEELKGYSRKEFWEENHSRNVYLPSSVGWKLNMLWSEKIQLVKETIDDGLVVNGWVGWCDIGYFRGGPTDIELDKIKTWGSFKHSESMSVNKIYYGLVHPQNLARMFKNIHRDEKEMPEPIIPHNQVSVAGGFFICHKNILPWWHTTFYNCLERYIENNAVVKDDQIIIVDCILSNLSKFNLIREPNPHVYDKWFVFQRYLG